MSERQLVVAMAASGRSLALPQLVRWRGDGLLPPLASTGSGNGRCYYWREPDILEQARAAYDALHHHGRVDAALITLWLNGFAVPLPRLRRAWQHGQKMRKARAVRRASPIKQTPTDLADALQHAALSAAATLAPHAVPTDALAFLEMAGARLGLQGSAAIRQYWAMAQMTIAALADSALLQQASDDELQNAQRIAGTGLDFIFENSDAASRGDVVDALGEPLFLYALAMLCSGQDAILHHTLNWIDAQRPRRPQPHSQPVHLPA